MENVRLFFQFLQKFIYITEDEFNQYIKPYIQVRQFRKKQIISQTGEIEFFFNFVLKGMARKYFKKNKEEINTQISTEGHIIYVDESFHSKKPSEFVIEAIEPCILASISFDDLEKIYKTNVKMERMGRLLITLIMTVKNRWQMSMIKLTPRERFLSFIRKHPELLQRVPQKYLASFLNIQPETFSRFKHLLREKV